MTIRTLPAQLSNKTMRLIVNMARSNTGLMRPERAAGECGKMSFRFAMLLEENDIEYQIIEAAGPPRRYLLLHEYTNHYAVLTQGVVVDFTARQYDPEVDFPFVVGENTWQAWMVTWLGFETDFIKGDVVTVLGSYKKKTRGGSRKKVSTT